jgi:peptidoglycan hydrolase-like protein with peptidoglycan-binding domain
MICMIAALAAFPLVAGAQQSGTMTPTYEEEQMNRHLMPKDAHPRGPNTSEARPSEAMPQGNLVRDAQVALRDAGYKPGRIDGVMGPTTQAAIREFQTSHGLPQTGTLDATTQQQLFAARTPESSWRR